MTAPDPLHAYIVVSLLTGARTEELRALRWEHVHLDPPSRPGSVLLPPYVEVWRSVRANAETKTKKSRRTLALPSRRWRCCGSTRVEQMRQHLRRQIKEETGLVFTTSTGAALDAANVRRDFRRALTLVPGLDPEEWTPREMRHSFVPLLSESGVPMGSWRICSWPRGYARHGAGLEAQLRPVIESGAVAMEQLFGVEHQAGHVTEDGGESA